MPFFTKQSLSDSFYALFTPAILQIQFTHTQRNFANFGFAIHLTRSPFLLFIV